ncbi:hypothetical protein AYO51_01220 [Lactiplantibacillus plantarum]|nr:hypothetical protein AYO51_01220 [Lactiplantibacillus plantarum]KYM69280.1 hypothetical protein AZJ01_02385 [Lactiplantibacillus plantarum]
MDEKKVLKTMMKCLLILGKLIFKNCLKLLSMNLTRSKRICMIPCILMFCRKDKKILLIVLASLFSPLKAC